MSRRLSLVLLAGAAALVFALPGGARSAQTTLHGVVGPGFTINLTDDSGNRVTHLDPGTYTIDVKDQSNQHNFDLQGPGVSQATDVEFVGSATWTVTFTEGTYKYNCDAQTVCQRFGLLLFIAGEQDGLDALVAKVAHY